MIEPLVHLPTGNRLALTERRDGILRAVHDFVASRAVAAEDYLARQHRRVAEAVYEIRRTSFDNRTTLGPEAPWDDPP